MASANLTAERLRELLHYDPLTGVFTRLVDSRCGKGRIRCMVGDVAGYVNDLGYVVIQFNRVNQQAHRLAFLYMDSAWPAHDVDHINGIRSDNRWSNLRIATRGQNMQNMTKPKGHNTTGLLGVAHHGKRFRAQIGVDKKLVHIGVFDTAEQAYAAYLEAKARLHPFSRRS